MHMRKNWYGDTFPVEVRVNAMRTNGLQCASMLIRNK